MKDYTEPLKEKGEMVNSHRKWKEPRTDFTNVEDFNKDKRDLDRQQVSKNPNTYL